MTRCAFLYCQFLFVLLLLTYGCSCSDRSDRGGNDAEIGVDVGSSKSDPGKDPGASSENSVRIEEVQVRKGFGPLGQNGERRISFLSTPECGIDAFDNKVVYCDTKGGLYIVDIESEIEKKIGGPFFQNIVSACYPSIWNTTVVFQALKESGGVNTSVGLAVCDFKQMQCLWLGGNSDQRLPRVHGNNVVWQDYRYFDGKHPDPEKRRNIEIYMYNLKTGSETRITNAPRSQYEPDIFGDYIVWRDGRDIAQKEIFMYKISTREEKNISNNIAHQWAPRISDNSVVWTDLRNGIGGIVGHQNTDIYYYNIDTEELRQVTTDLSDQEHPKIRGRYIVWNDMRDGSRSPNGYPSGANVYLYDLETGEERRVTYSSANDGAGRIAGDKIVWYSQRDGKSSLYMKPLSEL